MYNVFLSHNRRDKPWVREFAQVLRKGGLEVFFDEDSINPGEDTVRAIERAIENSKHVIFVITASSLASHWVGLETAITVYEDPGASRRSLIPVMLEWVDRKKIPPSVRRLTSVDLSDPGTRETRFREFIRHIGVSNSDASPIPTWPKADHHLQDLSMVSLHDVLNWGWDGEKLLDELIRIDYQTLDQLKDIHEGNTAQWAPVFTDHPDTWRLLISSPGHIVGYWHFVPLFEAEYEQAKLGQLLDGQITTNKVRIFEITGRYNIYFVSVCLLPNYRGTSAVRLLFDSMFVQLTELARQGIFIDEICANAYTPTGEAFCKSFGLTYLRDHADHGKIYCGTFAQFFRNRFLNSYSELRRLYTQ
jgi:TIR domain